MKPGKFVWQDLVTQDVAEARAFYGALFGWTFREGDRYIQVLHEGEPIGGDGASSFGDRDLVDAGTIHANARRLVEDELLQHGDVDGAVPWYQSIEFYLGLRRNGKHAPW